MPPDHNNADDHELLQPGVLESLIKSGRVPFDFGDLRVAGEKPQITFHLPPEGTQKGDRYECARFPLLPHRFSSPEGEDRGDTTVYTVPEEVSIQIIDIRNRILAKLNSTSEVVLLPEGFRELPEVQTEKEAFERLVSVELAIERGVITNRTQVDAILKTLGNFCGALGCLSTELEIEKERILSLLDNVAVK